MTLKPDNHRRSERPAGATRGRRPAERSSAAVRQESRLGNASRRLGEFMDSRPLLDYTMIRTVVLVLAGLGVVMVLSSSMAMSVANNQAPWSIALRQLLMVIGGLIAFWAALKIPPSRLHKLSVVLMWLAVLLLIAVLTPLGTGKESVGSQSWLELGPLRLQPSELARIAIAIWGAQEVANKDATRPLQAGTGTLRFTVVSVTCLALIAAQGDFGMAVSFALVVAFILLFAGISWRTIGIFAGIGAIFLFSQFAAGGFRSNRFHVYFDALLGHFEDTRGIAFQSHQGFLSLADGALFGVGLGQSRAKWFYLPEAQNDFIFAVIGEELGLWGGALVICLFAMLGYFGLRAARRAQTQEQRLMAASLAAAVVSQAFINIGYVVGLLPVTGIQLPMLSAGGTSAVITFGAMGVLASVARHEPDAVSAMQNYGRPLFDQLLMIGEPRPVDKQGTPRPKTTSRKREGSRSGRVVRPNQRDARFGTPVTARGATGSGRRTDDERGRPSRRREQARYDEPRNSARRGERRAG